MEKKKVYVVNVECILDGETTFGVNVYSDVVKAREALRIERKALLELFKGRASENTAYTPYCSYWGIWEQTCFADNYGKVYFEEKEVK